MKSKCDWFNLLCNLYIHWKCSSFYLIKEVTPFSPSKGFWSTLLIRDILGLCGNDQSRRNWENHLGVTAPLVGPEGRSLLAEIEFEHLYDHLKCLKCSNQKLTEITHLTLFKVAIS